MSGKTVLGSRIPVVNPRSLSQVIEWVSKTIVVLATDTLRLHIDPLTHASA